MHLQSKLAYIENFNFLRRDKFKNALTLPLDVSLKTLYSLHDYACIRASATL